MIFSAFFQKFTFQRQLTIIVTVCILFFALFSSIFGSWQSNKRVRHNLIEQGLHITDDLARQSTLALIYSSAENAAETVKATLDFPGVIGVEIRDTNQHILLKSGNTELPTQADQFTRIDKNSEPQAVAILDAESPNSWSFVAPVYSQPPSSPYQDVTKPELLGQVTVVMSKAALTKMTTGIFVSNLTSSFFFALLLLFMIRYLTIRMTRPLNQLSTFMGRAESGESKVRAVLAGPKDITDMAHAFNSMMSVLEERETELSRIAHYDVLTGMPNRVLLADRMNLAIAQTAREQNMMAVCYLDLDGFKPINDTLGHDSGDHMLIEVARRIENTIRGSDTVARLGGDEFVVLLLGLEKGEECVGTLERLLAAIAHPITIKNKHNNISASIGVSIYPLDDEDPDTLLRHADQAMYVAKQSGKNRFHIYDPALDRRARDQHVFIKNIRHGLENNQFELYYQPKVNLLTSELIGAEALIRWRHPERGLLSPGEFLHHIENTHLDIEIGEWVTATALTQMSYWRSSGLDIEISINISGYHMESVGFVEKLKQQLSLHPDMQPGKLQIEVLETIALNDIGIVRKIIEECRMIGVGFALDDFGTGYSSLSYLSNLPVDALKIDQSFVKDMLEDKGVMAIVQGIIALARAFDRQTVAEGIETDEHYQILLDMGCELGQGYGIARPMPAVELTSWKIKKSYYKL